MEPILTGKWTNVMWFFLWFLITTILSVMYRFLESNNNKLCPRTINSRASIGHIYPIKSQNRASKSKKRAQCPQLASDQFPPRPTTLSNHKNPDLYVLMGAWHYHRYISWNRRNRGVTFRASTLRRFFLQLLPCAVFGRLWSFPESGARWSYCARTFGVVWADSSN